MVPHYPVQIVPRFIPEFRALNLSFRRFLVKTSTANTKQSIAQVLKLTMLLAYTITGLCVYLVMRYVTAHLMSAQVDLSALSAVDVLLAMLAVGGVSYLGIALQMFAVSKMIDKTLVERA